MADVTLNVSAAGGLTTTLTGKIDDAVAQRISVEVYGLLRDQAFAPTEPAAPTGPDAPTDVPPIDGVPQ